MPHVDEGQLHALLDGAYQSDSPEARGIHAHLSACADCRALLESERIIRERALDLLERARPLPETVPPFETIVARAQPRRSANFQPARLAWAATVVMAIGLGWFGRDLTTRRSEQVAQESVDAVAPARPNLDPVQGESQTQSSPGMAGSAAPQNPPPAVSSAPAPAGLADRAVAPPAEADFTARQFEQRKQAQTPARTELAKTRAAEESGPVTAQMRAVTGSAAGAAAFAPSAPGASWSEVSLEVAERTAGRRVLLMPGFELVKLELMPGANGYAIRAAQRIPGDGLLELVQEPANETPPSAQSRRRTDSAGDASNSALPNVASLQIGELRITARAAVSPDSLRVLLGRLR